MNLLVIQGVIVAQICAKKRVGLDERASAGQKLYASAREGIHRGELLIDPSGILCGQHGDRASHMDPRGLRQRRRDHRGRRGDRVFRPVVFTDPHVVESDFFRQPRPLQHMAKRSRRVLTSSKITERIDPKFHVHANA